MCPEITVCRSNCKRFQMKRLFSIIAICLPISIVAACVMALPIGKVGPTFEEIATSKVTDLEANVNVLKADQDELKKIGKDFGMAYKLKGLTMRFKKPCMLRMDGKIGQESALYIVNGP